MALVWIVTTGNSDFKVDREDGFLHLRTEKNLELKPCQKKFPKLIQGDDKLFSLPVRVMGIVYGDTWKTHEKYFRFPLLEEFTKKLNDENKIPDRIIVLLTNQEKIFLEDNEDHRYDRSEDSPYWRDTSRLEPIFKHYFDREFGEGKVLFPFPVLEPETRQEGLDNWDSTLKLVQKQFEKWNISKNDFVIVSHQASTPAISSAVQFVSLGKFGEKVDFLIANERDTDLTRFLEGSEYLKGIRKKEAEALLKSHNYSGVKDLLDSYLKDEKHQETKILLEAAIQWNFAKFDEFANEIQKLSGQGLQSLVQEAKERSQHYWWEAYEAAYLGIVRLKQGNTVEAMFHSFRAVEGLLKKWLYEKSGLRVEDGKAQLPREVEFISKKGERKKTRSANAYGQGLYFALDSIKDINKNQDIDIWTFGKAVFDRRNELFHQLGGLQDKEAVFAEWKAPHEPSLDEQGWKDRVKNCLNFVSDQQFGSIEAASLMVKVHQELERAIASL